MSAARAAPTGTEEARPEPDRVEGAPHPRETTALLGQEAAEAAFLDAFATRRLHHGWLLTGPRGVGKATLAWRIARFLLAQPVDTPEAGLFGDAPPLPDRLDIAPDHPVSRRVAALSEPGLFLLRRAWDEDKKRLKTRITVDEVRRLKGFFGLTSADGGRRVVIVDAADEMNPAAANAILKLLEEPPARTTMLLISHRPSGLLPTLRSRCRALRLATLTPDAMAAALAAALEDHAPDEDAAALAQLAGGSVGEAIRLTNLGGMESYRALVALAATLPGLDHPRAIALSEAAGQRGAEARLELTIGLIETLLARLALTGATGHPPPEAAPNEAAILHRLAPTPEAGRLWAEAHQTVGARARHALAVNLDPAALVLDMVLKMNDTAAPIATR